MNRLFWERITGRGEKRELLYLEVIWNHFSEEVEFKLRLRKKNIACFLNENLLKNETCYPAQKTSLLPTSS